MGLSYEVVSRPTGWLERIWTAECDSPADFSSVAKVTPMIAFARIAGTTMVHLRGPETKATAMSCLPDTEYFGAEFRLGAYLRPFPPVRLANLRDAVLPTLPDGRILLDNQAWEMPTPQNLDVFIGRLERAGLLAFDPLVEELRHGGSAGTLPERTAQSRFVRAVGLSRRHLRVIERARHAARLLRAGTSIADVVHEAGYYDQPHLTRALRQLIGHTPAVLAGVPTVPRPLTCGSVQDERRPDRLNPRHEEAGRIDVRITRRDDLRERLLGRSGAVQG